MLFTYTVSGDNMPIYAVTIKRTITTEYINVIEVTADAEEEAEEEAKRRAEKIELRYFDEDDENIEHEVVDIDETSA